MLLPVILYKSYDELSELVLRKKITLGPTRSNLKKKFENKQLIIENINFDLK